MSNVRAETYAAIRDNDLGSVVFVDPFTLATRSAKRNLLIASVVSIMIAVLQLEISGFLGLQATSESLGNPLAQGLACLITAYFLLSAAFQMYVDYSAWQFKRERLLTEPYLELINLLERHISTTQQQIRNAIGVLDGISLEAGMQPEIEAQKSIKSSIGQINSIERNISSLTEEVRPLLGFWSDTISRMKRLNARLRMRFLSLWLLDIVFPLLLGAIAVLVTSGGVAEVIKRIAA